MSIYNTTIWFTGLPCSGKTTIADTLRHKLVYRSGISPIRLDGDIVRKGLTEDCDFSPAGRRENLRRVSHVCQILNENDCTALASFVSPSVKVRDMIREIVDSIQIVYVDCPVEVCKERDVKGMYEKASKGEIKEFTGVSAPYEEPLYDFRVNTDKESTEESVNKVLDFLLEEN